MNLRIRASSIIHFASNLAAGRANADRRTKAIASPRPSPALGLAMRRQNFHGLGCAPAAQRPPACRAMDMR